MKTPIFGYINFSIPLTFHSHQNKTNNQNKSKKSAFFQKQLLGFEPFSIFSSYSILFYIKKQFLYKSN